MELDKAIGQIWRSDRLTQDFNEICDCGGRFAGTQGELQARQLLKDCLEEILTDKPISIPYDHRGWHRNGSGLKMSSGRGTKFPSTSLVLAPPVQDLELEILDLGRGAQEDFEARWEEIRGKAVLVRHEFPFSISHVHRRRKYGWAVEAGAKAFIIANNIPGIGVVTGSSGSGSEHDLPALGTSYEAGMILADSCRNGKTYVRINLDSEYVPAQSEHIIAEISGQTNEVIVLCAHLDGHHLAESAMDNGSGLAVALEVTRQLAPVIPSLRRGLRVIFFTVEEWALTGSRVYVQSLTEEERRKISLVVNLDTVVGSPRMTALVSGRSDVADFVQETTRTTGSPVAPIYPLQANSDHYNFHLGGIPALRLIAGYEDPDSMTRYLLTPADTRDKVDVGQLRLAAMTTASLVYEACQSREPVAQHFNPQNLKTKLDARDPWVADRT